MYARMGCVCERNHEDGLQAIAEEIKAKQSSDRMRGLLAACCCVTDANRVATRDSEARELQAQQDVCK